jgi:hypothetical protein
MSQEDESVTPVTTHSPRGSSFRAAPLPRIALCSGVGHVDARLNGPGVLDSSQGFGGASLVL